ncbi:MAG: calcium-activated potassium channel [archaeon]|nr:calcium-activated potassium channel [archaeon]
MSDDVSKNSKNDKKSAQSPNNSKSESNSVSGNQDSYDMGNSDSNQVSDEGMLARDNKKIKRKIQKKASEIVRNKNENKQNSFDVGDDIEKKEEYNTCRHSLEKFLSVGDRQFIFELIITIASILSFIFYIVCTYITKLFKYFNFFDMIIVFIYFIEYVIQFSLAHQKILFIISFSSLFNLIVMVPSLFCFLTDDYMHSVLYMFINASRVVRFSKIFNILFNMKDTENNVTMKLITIISILVQIIFISAGLTHIVEFTAVENRLKEATDLISRRSLEMRQNFHHYIYLLIVTTLTVGYGDIIPFTPLAKGMFLIIILLVIGIIPYQINDLIQIMGAQNEYQLNTYKASKEIPHIILTGDISLDSLKSFCHELFHPDHGSQRRHAVIINNNTPSHEMEMFLNNEQNVYYLQGDPLQEKDLLRGDTQNSRACIIFNNKNSKDPFSMDHQSLFLGIFIKKFVYNYNHDLMKNTENEEEKMALDNPYFHLCMQLNKPESNCHYFNTLQSLYKKKMKTDQLIIIESLKMNLLSKSCLTPGIMALITNLVISSGDSNKSKGDAEWLKEYREGRGHEIYRILLPPFLKNKTFLELVDYVYGQAQAIVFALEIELGSGSVVKLNPSNNQKICDIIRKASEGSLIDKTKTSYANYLTNNQEEEDEGSKNVTFGQNLELRCKVFAYLICSDKSVAEEVSKEKEINQNNSSDAQYMEQKDLNQSSAAAYSKGKDAQSSAIEKTERNEDSDSDSAESYTANEEIMQFGSSDLVFCKKDYYFSGNTEFSMRNNVEIMHHSIKDREDITNHIIICGLHPALVHFILPLRAKYLKEDSLKWVVILAPNLPQSLFEAFTKFNRIIFIQGSPLLPENLLRANILNADKAVILSSGESKVIKPTNTKTQIDHQFYSEEQMLDAETIFIYKAIKKCNKNIQIMTELICTNNIEYLLNTSNLQKLFTGPNEGNNTHSNNETSQYEFTPLYASGEVFTPSIIDRITCQSYYNPHIVTIIELILGGENNQLNKKAKKLEDIFKLGGSNLYLVKIPEAFINESFGEFFYFLVKVHHSISIALYRKNIIEGYYYVYTNPKRTTLLRDCDFAFILANSASILDLLEERGLVDNDNFSSDPDVEIKEEGKKEEGNISPKHNDKSNITNNDTSAINKKLNDSRRSSDADRDVSRRGTKIDRTIREEKKALGNPKHNEIDRLKNKLMSITDDLQELKEEFGNINEYVDEKVSEEIMNELKVYLNKS